jgi:hypothetical protein
VNSSTGSATTDELDARFSSVFAHRIRDEFFNDPVAHLVGVMLAALGSITEVVNWALALRVARMRIYCVKRRSIPASALLMWQHCSIL